MIVVCLMKLKVSWMNSKNTTLFITEKTLGLIILVSFLFRSLGIPGGDFLLVVSIVLLSLMYCFFTLFIVNEIRIANIFKLSTYKEFSLLRLIGTILLGLILSVVCLGILFSLLHWQGARYFSLIGIPFLLIAFLLVGYKLLITKSGFYLRLIVRIGIIGAIGLTTFVVS